MATYLNSSNQIAALKELYVDPREVMQNMVYKENPAFALIPKDESPTGFVGKYFPVPIIYGNPQGRSHTFSTAQSNQTAALDQSYFVYVIQDYELVTLQNLFLEQTKSDAGAFIDGAKLAIDTGFRNLSNNVAFEIFGNGFGTRGILAASGGYSKSGATVTMTLSNANYVVNFENGMTLTAGATDGGAPSADYVTLTTVNRSTGVLIGTASTGSSALSGNWANGAFLAVQGDVPSSGVSTIGAALCTAGFAAWLPKTAPTTGDNFWGVDRSVDPTRLGGLRFDATAYTIEEGLTQALAFSNREGAKPDLAIMDFASYAALVNSLGAKVVYAQVEHDEVEVAFEGIQFQSAYGRVTVLADRSCQPQTCYLLDMSTWKLRSLGKVPHILSYAMEGLEGLRVGNADALEIRIGTYHNMICFAPGRNCVVSLSA